MINCVYAQWPASEKIMALTKTRSGGISAAPYDSLNLGAMSGDTDDAVAENRKRLCSVLGLHTQPCWLHQIHGNRVIDVQDARAIPETERAADASVSTVAGAACAVLTADCLPVLLCDRDASVVAAAHCGWRGLESGVLASVVNAMHREPGELLAWMGPAIGPADYEVGADVRDAFVVKNELFEDAFWPNKNQRWQADLYTIAALQLNELGIDAVFGGSESTFADDTRFFSYRRDGECGRMASLIWIEE